MCTYVSAGTLLLCVQVEAAKDHVFGCDRWGSHPSNPFLVTPSSQSVLADFAWQVCRRDLRVSWALGNRVAV